MAMVEAMSQINDKPISQVTAFSHRFVRSAREGVAASFVSRTDADTFAATRLKAAQLPTVQSRQPARLAPDPLRVVRLICTARPGARAQATITPGLVIGARCRRNGLNSARHAAKPGGALTFALVIRAFKAARLLLDDTRKAAPSWTLRFRFWPRCQSMTCRFM